jgi:hypothetical protein
MRTRPLAAPRHLGLSYYPRIVTDALAHTRTYTRTYTHTLSLTHSLGLCDSVPKLRSMARRSLAIISYQHRTMYPIPELDDPAL